MDIRNLKVEDIQKMNYNELIGIVKETNRPPGGIKTIMEVLNTVSLDENSKILDIGTSTGFTAIEFARLTKCNVVGIDINQMSLDEAKKRAERLKLNTASFLKTDATNLPFKENEFDLVFCGNVTSLIPNRKKAFSEYIRVLKEGGFLVATPMYYRRDPPSLLIEKISSAIRTEIKIDRKGYWLSFFSDNNLQHISIKDFVFDTINSDRIDLFINNILSREHLGDLSEQVMKLLKEKYGNYISLFSENLRYMGYSLIILRKKDSEIDEELFTSTACDS
jgi:SAM-dependent methyltransferase